ncbi:MAG: hypothetical protein ACX931_10800 [Saccharospirillum sp.]
MWIQRLIDAMKARYRLAKWLKQQRLQRLDIPHLSRHLRTDMGLDNPPWTGRN